MAQNAMSDAMIRKKKTFYDQGDARLIFSDGEEIKVNKSLLAFNCDFFDKVFFGRNSKNEFYVEDFDSGTFLMFLDCLMGFREYNDLDALLIFPIAHKYQAEESLKQCIEVLRPSSMSQTVCITLNLALYYECEELVDDIMFFLQDKFNIQSLLETSDYCFLLEPHSMAKLVENIEIDSCLLKTICNWAENYLRKSKSKKSGSVVAFLREHKILNKIREFKFESFQTIFDFREAKETKELFTQEQLWSFLKDKIVIDNPRKFPNSSAWVSVKKGETLTENFSYAIPLELNFVNRIQATLQVWRNETIFTKAVAAGENPISCEISFTYAYCDTNYNGWYLYPNTASQAFNLVESSIVKKDKKYIYEILSPVTAQVLILQTFNITYTFNVDCRILKTSLDETFPNNNKTLYYTYAITKK